MDTIKTAASAAVFLFSSIDTRGRISEAGSPDTGQQSLLPTQTAPIWYNKDNKSSVAAILSQE